ncbi:hypothetical protein C351_02618 [Cryptococcus neoformans c8]|nr:hypothetical protein J007_02752 [Cryptococcus neoformans var. grubii]OXG64109.1 hypothetical protein C351_02618 [Cryptococcus neoformans var. grubii c8]
MSPVVTNEYAAFAWPGNGSS